MAKFDVLGALNSDPSHEILLEQIFLKTITELFQVFELKQ